MPVSSESSIQRYRRWYARLLRFYPKPFRDRYAEAMEQTFYDLCQERSHSGKGLFTFALWTFAETSAAIVRENLARGRPRQRNVIGIAILTALILPLPLVAMQFTDDVVWTVLDFATAGVLLFGTVLAFEMGIRRMSNLAYNAGIGLALATGLFLIWANLAVGLIGSEDERANLMYLGVLAVAIAGAAMARLQPPGMARAMFATALAQVSVAVIALIARMDEYAGSSVFAILGVNGFFITFWIAAALLFQRAGASDRSLVSAD